MRDSQSSKVVGPGAYDPNLSNKNRSAAWGFGTQAKGKLVKNDNPSPGTYDLGTTIGKGKAYGMRIKTKQSVHFKTPGPGTYEPTIDTASVKRKAPQIGIGTSERGSLYGKKSTPGPGSYAHNKEHAKNPPKFSFGNDKRSKFNKGWVPGPGTYESKTEFERATEKMKGTTMISRRPQSANPTGNRPGPGAYQENVALTRPSTAKYGYISILFTKALEQKGDLEETGKRR